MTENTHSWQHIQKDFFGNSGENSPELERDWSFLTRLTVLYSVMKEWQNVLESIRLAWKTFAAQTILDEAQQWVLHGRTAVWSVTISSEEPMSSTLWTALCLALQEDWEQELFPFFILPSRWAQLRLRWAAATNVWLLLGSRPLPCCYHCPLFVPSLMKPPNAVKASSSTMAVSHAVGLRYSFKVSIQYWDKTLEFISNLCIELGNNIKQRWNKARESYVKLS